LRRTDLQAVAVAAAAALVWLLAAPRTPDLAAQSYRVALFNLHGFLLWDNGWYAGHYLPDYSLLFPAFGSLVGMRVAGALAAVAAAGAFAVLAERHFGARARLGILWFAAATVSDLAIGRLTYSLGAALGLAALVALQRRRLATCALAAALCAAATPLAGLFVVFTALVALAERRLRRAAVVLGASALVVMVGLAVTFGEGGRQPFGGRVLVVAVVATLAFVVLMPAEQRLLRIGGLGFLAFTVAAFVVPTALGDNVTRLAAVFMGPLLACALLVRRPRGALAIAAGVALVGLLVYQWYAPLREIRKGDGDRLASAADYSGLLRFLGAHRLPLGRVEVPFTTSHWENAVLALRVPLARGWEKQLDTKYDGLFYRREHPLAPGVYHAWLRELAVRYVAVPAVSLDPAARQEVGLIDAGLRFLRPVYRDSLWRVFAVLDPLPFAAPPAVVTRVGVESLRLRFSAGGSSLVRVRFTPYWLPSRGCVAPGAGGYTFVTAPNAGTVTLSTDFSIGRVFLRGRRCAQQ
jgi:hypothetical protein